MALTESVTIEGKLIPTRISIFGDRLDLAQGVIELGTGLVTESGDHYDRGLEAFDLATELAFTDSNGTTGPQVLQYLAEWFEHKRQ